MPTVLPTYVELRNVEDRLEDTYHNHGHHPITVYESHVNKEGWVWREHYWNRRAEGMNHEQAIRWVESQIDIIEGRPDRWAPPPPEPIEPGLPPTSSIGVEGRFFVRAVLVFLALTIASIAHAQNPNVTPADSFAWNQTAADLNTAQNYVYKYYLDGAMTGSVWANVTCAGTTAPFTCTAKTPTFANGTHSLTITAANAGGESAQSVPFAFVFGNPPVVPNNIRVVKGTP